MSEVTRIKTAQLVNTLFFNGRQQQQIVLEAGVTLALSHSGLFVIAKPTPGSGRDTLHIPMSNVKSIVLIDEDVEAAKALEAEVRIKAAAKVIKPPASVLRGTVKFVKDAVTGAIVERTE